MSVSAKPPGGIPAPELLLGRDAEIEVVQRLLDRARESLSSALVVVGEAGVGKSALLAHARASATGMRVLSCAGVESEAALPFAALHQLLRPVLGHVPALPRPQASALRRALGMEPGSSDERFLVSVAVLGLLDDAGAAGPVLCLVDDAHWLDDASAEVLHFVARRLEAEGIVMLFSSREGDRHGFDSPYLPQIRLAGLDDTAAAQLLEASVEGALAPSVRDELVTATAGNPLALLELAAALTDEQRSGVEPVLGPLPVSSSVERAFLVRVRRLPEDTQTMLLVAAADDSGELRNVLVAAERLGIGSSALDPAEAAGLVRVHGSRLELRHPLIRSAVYHGAPASRRRAAHASLAEAFPGEVDADRRAWHRAAASGGPDPDVVAELEHAARRAQRRGGYATASVAFERAATFAADEELRARQLAAAAEAAWMPGNVERTLGLLRRARPLTGDPLLLADIARLEGLVELISGVPAIASKALVRAAADVASLDADRALELLTVASLAAMYACDDTAIVEISATARRLPAGESPGARFLRLRLDAIGDHYAKDFASAVPKLRAAVELAEHADAAGPTELAELIVLVGSTGLFLGDDAAVGAVHERMVARAREAGAVSLLTRALPRLALSDIWAGHWASSEARLTEGLELARGTRQHQVVAYLHSVHAILAALRGDEATCRSLVDRSFALAAERRLAHVRYLAMTACLMLEVGLGRTDEALDRGRMLASTAGYDHWCPLDRIESAIRAGDRATAREWLGGFEPWASSTEANWAAAVVAHCRALLADDHEEAQRLFSESLRLHRAAARPFSHARTELAFGELLRRARRRVESREHLRAALDTFERLGAKLWAERARIELRASGQTARRRDPTTLDHLTPQELQIAVCVARGATNRQVATELFLSPRTVDFHLRNIFRKLDITSRRQLMLAELGNVPTTPAAPASRA